MTVTNEERRRVALELREAGKSHDEFDGDMIGRSIYVYLTLIKIACDPRLGMKKGIFDSLADLIEPTPKCSEPTPKCDASATHTDASATVDCDALLALAEGLDNKANDLIRDVKYSRFQGMGPRMDKARQDAFEWRCIARLIRKALGGRWQ